MTEGAQPQTPIGAALKVRIKQALVKAGRSEKEAAEIVNSLKTSQEAMKLLEELGSEQRKKETPKEPASSAEQGEGGSPEQKGEDGNRPLKVWWSARRASLRSLSACSSHSRGELGTLLNSPLMDDPAFAPCLVKHGAGYLLQLLPPWAPR